MPVRLVPARLRRLYRRLYPHRPPDLAGIWDRACVKWVVGHVGPDPAGGTVVTGWAVVPAADRPHVRFTVNGEPPSEVRFPVPRPDVAAQLRVVPDAAASGFDLTLPAPAGDPDYAVGLADARTGRPLGAAYPPYHVPSAGRSGPLAAGNRIARVIGAPSDFYFRLGGYTAFLTLAAAVERATGRGVEAFPRVLDWGCGCARVSRYFLGVPGVELTGADVDPDNVGWCRDHFPQARWEVLPLRPPSELPTAGFDLAFGVSVFTHLKEPDQLAWLAELERVVRPGGLALMTFHGEASVFWAGLSAERYDRLTRKGIADQANPLYDADLGEPDYYRDTFHTREYVERVWGRHFEILAVEPCAVAHQDLVVMRRR